MEILSFKNLNFRYSLSPKESLKNVTFSVDKGSFNVLCGPTGSGKSTILRLIKKEIAPKGELTGDISLFGTSQQELEKERSVFGIGYVTQDPDDQFISLDVMHELSFALENRCLPASVIQKRVSEISSFFGIEHLYSKKISEISGGEKQLVNLAAAMVVRPEIMLLDEPCSQLDPIAASSFIQTLRKIKDELGTTIIIAEHRLEELFPIADNIIYTENGSVMASGSPRDIASKLAKTDFFESLPCASKIFFSLGGSGICPMTVNEGSMFLEDYTKKSSLAPAAKRAGTDQKDISVSLKNIYFRYSRDLPDVLLDLSLNIKKGCIHCILGGNGTGKTTLLNIISGISKPYSGKAMINGKPTGSYKDKLYGKTLTVIPQDPKTIFVNDTVSDDLLDTVKAVSPDDRSPVDHVKKIANMTGISHLLERDPYEISGGELQKCAIAKSIISDPEILCFDEPTKGLDAHSKKDLYSLLLSLKDNGKTVIIVTHDLEFAALCADDCSLLFNGCIVANEDPVDFFSSNYYYTTATCRIAHDIVPNAIIYTDIKKDDQKK